MVRIFSFAALLGMLLTVSAAPAETLSALQASHDACMNHLLKHVEVCRDGPEDPKDLLHPKCRLVAPPPDTYDDPDFQKACAGPTGYVARYKSAVDQGPQWNLFHWNMYACDRQTLDNAAGDSEASRRHGLDCGPVR